LDVLDRDEKYDVCECVGFAGIYTTRYASVGIRSLIGSRRFVAPNRERKRTPTVGLAKWVATRTLGHRRIAPTSCAILAK
jgi:hypothetical protein